MKRCVAYVPPRKQQYCLTSTLTCNMTFGRIGVGAKITILASWVPNKCQFCKNTLRVLTKAPGRPTRVVLWLKATARCLLGSTFFSCSWGERAIQLRWSFRVRLLSLVPFWPVRRVAGARPSFARKDLRSSARLRDAGPGGLEDGQQEVLQPAEGPEAQVPLRSPVFRLEWNERGRKPRNQKS